MLNIDSKVVNLGTHFGAVALKVNGIYIDIAEDGKSINIVSGAPIEVTTAAQIDLKKNSTDIANAKNSLEIGDRIKDGTVVIAVDLKKNIALFAPEELFGGRSDFDHQIQIAKQANLNTLHGHKGWRTITDLEAINLANAWEKVAPAELKGRASPWFWGASEVEQRYGVVFHGGISKPSSIGKRYNLPVPVVRTGRARI